MTPQDPSHLAASPIRSVSKAPLSGTLTALFAFAVAAIVLNLYASQPLVALIGPALGLSETEAGLVTTVTLLGYAVGLFLLVPLTDLVENRRLVVGALCCDVAAALVLALAPTATLFLLASFIVGLTTSAIQMLVPLAALMSEENERGRVVGNVMSGLMFGILLSRPIASLVAEFLNWRAFYGFTAVLIGMVAAVLWRVLPARRPPPGPVYGLLIASLWTLFREEPMLRLRAATQALCMAAFSVFWTAVALRLAQAPFYLGQAGIACFALAGAAGAVIAPIAGRLGDQGWTRGATILAHVGVTLAMLLAGVAGSDWFGWTTRFSPNMSMGMLVAAAILLDLGVICDQTLGRRAINLLQPEARGRLNGLFTGTFFLGGTVGAGLAGYAWTHGGWSLVCICGSIFGLLAFLCFASSRSA